MTEPFIGELRCFGFNFAPRGRSAVPGPAAPISPNTALFSCSGPCTAATDRPTSACPTCADGRRSASARGRASARATRARPPAGRDAATSTAQQVAPHTHPAMGATDATAKSPAGTVPGYTADGSSASATLSVAMNAGMIGPNSGGQPHDNMQPYQVLNWCIALEGIYPARS